MHPVPKQNGSSADGSNNPTRRQQAAHGPLPPPPDIAGQYAKGLDGRHGGERLTVSRHTLPRLRACPMLDMHQGVRARWTGSPPMVSPRLRNELRTTEHLISGNPCPMFLLTDAGLRNPALMSRDNPRKLCSVIRQKDMAAKFLDTAELRLMFHILIIAAAFSNGVRC